MVCFAFINCSFQNDSFSKQMQIKDISENTDYANIITQGFMGGAVIYNESNISLGQLDKGVVVAVRLCKAESKIVDGEKEVFRQINETAEYGILKIDDIDKESISFSFKLYNQKGMCFANSQHSLKIGESDDLNGDGIADIEYVPPIIKRSGYEKATYLNFISSQHTKTIAMYAVIKEQYPGEAYPNGIIGVNNNGRFIIQKYVDVDNNQRNVIRGAYAGDYIVDNEKGIYQRISNNRYARAARSISDSDLENVKNDMFDKCFYFMEEDFAFTSPSLLLDELPEVITERYAGMDDIDKLNRILEDKDLISVVSSRQNTIIPEEQLDDYITQMFTLTVEETVQLNRVFLEKNFPSVCPQRITVSDAITEILPLSSVLITESDINSCVDDIECYNDSFVKADNTERNAFTDLKNSISEIFVQAKNKNDYLTRIGKMDYQYDTYKNVITFDTFPNILNQDDKEKPKEVTANLRFKEQKLCIGIKGSFNSTWGSVQSSLGAAVYLKFGGGLTLNVQRYDTKVDKVAKDFSGSITTEKESVKKDDKGFNLTDTVPLINKEIEIFHCDKKFSHNLASFCIGPVVIGINLDLSYGIPINLNVELDGTISYDIYFAYLTQTGIEVGMDYGVEWRKVLFVKYPYPYISYYKKDLGSKQGLFYVDLTGESLNKTVNKMGVTLSLVPYVKAGIRMSIASVVHGGLYCNWSMGGDIKFIYENYNLRGSTTFNKMMKITAEIGIGLKNVRVLGFKIGDLGKTWSFNIGDPIVDVKTPESIIFSKTFK